MANSQEIAWPISRRPIPENWYIEHSRPKRSLDGSLALTPAAKADVIWWRDKLADVNGKPIFPVKADLSIYSDASGYGWGAHCAGVRARGPWVAADQNRHSNELELLAALYGLQSFAHNSTNISMALYSDNLTTVCYINKGGGFKSKSLSTIARDIASWAEARKIVIRAFHVPGVENIVADEESRTRSDYSDWRLNPSYFRQIARLWQVEVDLFASSWNAQLEKFFSWQPQPGAWALNAFALN